MTNRKTQHGQRRGTLQVAKVETDFEALIAAAIAAVVTKPSKQSRKPRPRQKVSGRIVD
jgi:hypothetical protein